jgi:hypothetical protein
MLHDSQRQTHEQLITQTANNLIDRAMDNEAVEVKGAEMTE